MSKRKLIPRNINVYSDQAKWLDMHREINLSATVRKWIDAKMQEE